MGVSSSWSLIGTHLPFCVTLGTGPPSPSVPQFSGLTRRLWATLLSKASWGKGRGAPRHGSAPRSPAQAPPPCSRGRGGPFPCRAPWEPCLGPLWLPVRATTRWSEEAGGDWAWAALASEPRRPRRELAGRTGASG